MVRRITQRDLPINLRIIVVVTFIVLHGASGTDVPNDLHFPDTLIHFVANLLSKPCELC